MKKIAVIGAGISGLTTATFLQENGYDVTIFEKEKKPGGLIRCNRKNGSLFHICGGHVFNTKNEQIKDWFWAHMGQENFLKADRNAIIKLNHETTIPYPIENNFHTLDKETQIKIIKDLLQEQKTNKKAKTFGEFVEHQFGKTLYELYFKPYNDKIWGQDIHNIPIDWLDGKMPIANVTEIIYNNINKVNEKQFVHSSFWYEKENGSQFIADKLAHNLQVRYNCPASEIEVIDGKMKVSIQGESYDEIVFCGNIKDLTKIIKGIELGKFAELTDKFDYHGTTTVFCEIDKNPYSWIYLPNTSYKSHRIICTGNFSATNNATGHNTGTIEFTENLNFEEIKQQLNLMPFSPTYITHVRNEYTYPIQKSDTREIVKNLKEVLRKHHIHFTGRFADWEYYNMDVAIEAALRTCKNEII